MTGDELFWIFISSFLAFWVGVVVGIWLADRKARRCED